MSYVVIRVRGGIGLRHDIRRTLHLMRLNKVNHCVILPETPSSKGMLQKTKDYITWGSISKETLARLLMQRGKLEGNDRISDTHINKNSPYTSVLKFSDAILKGETEFGGLKDVKPLLRMPPPRKGWGGIKRSFVNGGALGYRGDAMEDLVNRMLDAPPKR